MKKAAAKLIKNIETASLSIFILMNNPQ